LWITFSFHHLLGYTSEHDIVKMFKIHSGIHLDVV
jgi:hypothetical protein